MAQVINIGTEGPMKGERYFVDTNVWYWLTYVASKDVTIPSQPDEYQIQQYPRFIEDVLNSNSTLCHCALTFTELSNIIERTELLIYREKVGDERYSKKDFRKIEDSRKNVLREIDMAWNSINDMSECIDLSMDFRFTNDSFGIMNNSRLDPFDAFYVQIMKENNIDCIITDDHDFCTYKDGIVVTANQRAIS